ncbi:MepB family protein [Helicobacter pylori]
MTNSDVTKYKSLSLLRKTFPYIPNEAIEIEMWNTEYEAMNLYMNGKYYKSRLAKKTPKKAGYFVAIWHKNPENKNVPFKYEESPDILVINVIDNNHKGQFKFHKDMLRNKGIVQSQNYKGKMALRVYPDWEQQLNKTALATQKWQSKYFEDLSDDD